MLSAILVLLGLLGLVVGGEMLVRGAVSVAKCFRISPMIIGLTLVGFGTSTPELVTSLQAALSGSPGIAIGNVVGSNIGNVLLILGAAALVSPIAVERAAFRRDASVLVLTTLLCLAVILSGEIGRLAGLGFVAALCIYLGLTLWFERTSSGTEARDVYAAEADAVPGEDQPLGRALITASLGLVVLVFGARFLVAGAVELAQLAGISETVIGLTIVAIGTSMPELVTSLIAVRKGQGSVALGNVLGSNMFNILGILGVTAAVMPMKVPGTILELDIWVMCAATAALVIFARTGWRIGRREATILLASYGLYLSILLT